MKSRTLTGWRSFGKNLKDCFPEELRDLRKNNQIHFDEKGFVFYRAKRLTGKNVFIAKPKVKAKKEGLSIKAWLRIIAILISIGIAVYIHVHWDEIAEKNRRVMIMDQSWANANLSKKIKEVEKIIITPAEAKTLEEQGDKLPEWAIVSGSDSYGIISAKTNYSAEDSKTIIKNTFGKWGDKMLICMQSENGTFNPRRESNTNRDGSEDFGLMRINSVHCKGLGFADINKCEEYLLNPINNAKVGKSIFDGRKRGFSAWYGKTCKQFHGLVTK